jgi:hypothetical protein
MPVLSRNACRNLGCGRAVAPEVARQDQRRGWRAVLVADRPMQKISTTFKPANGPT